MVKIDYKNLTSFLITKELNWRQVKWAEILAEYHFKIKHVKGLDNTRADTLSKKEKLQRSDKMSRALFKENSDGKIRYNYLQLLGTYKVLISS